MVGMSEPMVARYTRLSVQRENAMAAVYHLERGGKETRTPDEWGPKKLSEGGHNPLK